MDLLKLIGDFWWLAPLAGAGLLAYKFLGWRGLVAVATLGAAGGLYTKGKRDERAALERKATADRLKAIEDRKDVDDEVSALDPDDRRDRLSGWVSNDKPR